jgi:hypothetical protein
MDEPAEKREDLPKPETFSIWGLLGEVIHGIAIALGLTLLWSLETVRNAFFRVLDRLNFKPRTRRASAFPPGRPRKRATADAHR